MPGNRRVRDGAADSGPAKRPAGIPIIFVTAFDLSPAERSPAPMPWAPWTCWAKPVHRRWRCAGKVTFFVDLFVADPAWPRSSTAALDAGSWSWDDKGLIPRLETRRRKSSFGWTRAEAVGRSDVGDDGSRRASAARTPREWPTTCAAAKVPILGKAPGNWPPSARDGTEFPIEARDQRPALPRRERLF